MISDIQLIINLYKETKLKRPSILIIFFILILAIVGFGGYKLLYVSNFETKKTVYVYIRQERNFEDLCKQLVDSAGCIDIGGFKWGAKLLKYPDNMKTGRYAVEPGMDNITLLNVLRRGQQTATRITFNNIRLKSELVERLSEQLMINEEDILSLINNPDYCDSLGFTIETIPVLFIPNTYEIYWNIVANKLLQRMYHEYNTFWTDSRREKAQAINLTPIEIAILASIVEEETAVADEYPVVAGLYLNRLKRDIPLQADPTVKFAVGDFSLQRVLYKYLEIESPYNTYKYTGLPPGPIRIPSIRGIDGVLNYMQHNYLYMCAKDDFSGRHNFAVTLAEHNRNAERYRAELNRRRIW
ncbi:MAG: endolytic transglycosylase MltG [Tannerellaceae bacterium]|nr:endolytic transglycosylase MltG [Tannerellaceae bacterium]